jgi:uncharacterized protein (TIGR02996 family)
MTTRAALLQAIIADPEADDRRLIFADWLQDNGEEARAEFIRVQVQLAGLDEDDPARPDLVRREQWLLARNQAWYEEVAKALRPGAVFRRGFIDEVDWTASAFIKGGGGLWKHSPVEVVRLSPVERQWEALLNSPHLERLRGLALYGAKIGSDGARDLAGLPVLAKLRSLALNYSDIGPEGFAALAASPHLAGLRHLELPGTRSGVEGLRALANSPWLTNLRSLHVDGNNERLGPSVATVLAQGTALGKLESLTVRSHDIGAEGAIALVESPRLPSLRFLCLWGSHIGPQGAMLSRCRGLERLTTLNLGWTSLGNDAAVAVAASPHLVGLHRLNLSSNDIDAGGTAALARFPTLGNLRTLDLSWNDIEADGVAALAASRHLKALTHLVLDRSHFKDAGVRALTANLWRPNLVHLNLSYCGIGDEGARALAECPHLSSLLRLDLSGNSFKDAGVAALAASPHLARLGELDLGGLYVSTAGVIALACSRRLTSLYSLNLSGCLAEDKAFRKFLKPDRPFAFTHLSLPKGGFISKPTLAALHDRFGHAVR